MKDLTIHKNKYPIYIPSKGRHESRLTIKLFDRLGIDYYVVVEPQEYDLYASVVDKSKLIITPHQNKGLTETRNFIWDYAQSTGVKKFWTFDDNIQGLFRLNRNMNIPVADGTILKCIEDFAERYENIGVCGMNYFMFSSRKSRLPPFTLNTRVYSNMLLNCDEKNPDGTPFRNNLYYNDDTDLNLRILKMGKCTVQFNAFLIDKATTMTVKGGNTEKYLSTEEDTRKKATQILIDAHPDCARMTRKFNRWHHEVDYSAWRKNKLIRVANYDELVGEQKVNNYGMELQYLTKEK